MRLALGNGGFSMRLFNFSSLRVVVMPLLAMAAAMPASATIFTDRPTWMAGVTGLTAYDFGLPGAGSSVSYNTSSGLLQSGLGLRLVGIDPTVQGGYTLAVVQGSASVFWYDWSSGAVGRSGSFTTGFAAPTIRITFTGGPVTAFGIDLGENGTTPGTGNLTITPEGQATTTMTTLVRPNFVFYGITSTTAFSYIDISPQTVNGYAIIDNIAYGTAGTAPDPTPEVGTLLTVASGLFLLAYKRRRALNISFNA